MATVILMIHLVLAVFLIAVVLLQRSEGGALGIGGGGGGMVSSRPGVTALSKVTWGLAIGFICTSLLLTIIAADRGTGSIFDQPAGDVDPAAIPLPALPSSGNAPLAPGGDIPLPAAPAQQ